ncbi:MAG TPA: PilZ domain-containing protein [Thermoanaerobaculia bacterium]|nr:PilZ domain-containing protein [Thermoanaerobaculia bacterium]
MNEERRAGGRAKAVVPIGVRVGRRKLTAGCTLDAGPAGALILCTENVPLGTELHVTNLQSDTWFTCRVVRNAGKHESGRHALGVEILAEGEEPPRPPAPRRGSGRRSS